MRQSKRHIDFEDYLKDQVKNHRMYAPDIVWRNIQTAIHGDKKWPALTFMSIFIIAAITAGTLLSKPNTHLLQSQYHPATQASIAISEKENTVAPEVLKQHLYADNFAKKVSHGTSALDVKILNEGDKIANADSSSQFPGLNTETADVKKNISSAGNITKINNPVLKAVFINNKESKIADEEVKNKMDESKISPASFSFMSPMNINIAHRFLMQSSFNNTDNYTFKQVKHLASPWATLPGYKLINDIKTNSRFSYQLYFTPSVSYRKLKDENSGHSPQTFISSLSPSANYNINVNEVVHHIPSLGMEAGVAFGYKLSSKLTVKSGIQFNLREYNIIAYKGRSSSSSPNLNSNNITNALPRDSSDNNALSTSAVGASSEIVLNDRYYEVAIPLGIDWRVVSLKKMSLSIAGSLQPTYTFDKQPFIITTDFKSYADGSSLMRNWNLNTSIEAYFSYKSGNYTWQIGPQFRYQQLPTFEYNYPVREHLLDYGLKIGFTRTIK